jgi:hypothetical protein
MTFQTVFKNDKEFEEFKTWTLGLLHDENLKSSVCVTFTKKDGTERAMQCTLIESRIPTDKHPKSDSQSQNSSTTGSAVRIFDTEVGEWRSFRWDSVTKVEFEL